MQDSRLGLPDNWLIAAAVPLLSERIAHYLRHPDEFGPGVTISFDDLARMLALKLHLVEENRSRRCRSFFIAGVGADLPAI